MTALTSFFETPLVVLDPMLLYSCSGFARYCWNPDGIDLGEPPINENEILFAIKNKYLIPPNVFSDTPDKNQSCNINDCSRRDHVARIAWFVENIDINTENLIEVDFFKDKSNPLSKTSVIPSGGCHRLCAMIYLKMSECVFKASSGDKILVESSNPFLRWYQNGPAHSNPFGKNIISSNNGAWDVDLNLSDEHDERIWINDLSLMGITVARFIRRGKISSCEIHSDKDISKTPFYKTGLTPREFILFCSEKISDDFKMLAGIL